MKRGTIQPLMWFARGHLMRVPPNNAIDGDTYSARLRAPMDYKKWAVWIILILGVAVLGWMAYRLSRQTSKPSEQSEGGDKSN